MVVVTAITCYFVYDTAEWASCPDEPAPRWYPVDRFKEGDGSAVI